MSGNFLSVRTMLLLYLCIVDTVFGLPLSFLSKPEPSCFSAVLLVSDGDYLRGTHHPEALCFSKGCFEASVCVS